MGGKEGEKGGENSFDPTDFLTQQGITELILDGHVVKGQIIHGKNGTEVVIESSVKTQVSTS